MKATHKLFVFVAIVGSFLMAAPIPHISGQTQHGEGDAWITMNSDNQFRFVLGYTVGLSKGFAEGCDAYYKIAPPQKPHALRDDLFAKCLAQGLGFSKPVAFYQKQITDFYTLFPGERDVPFEQVLKSLSDSENMTPQQIHQWFKGHGKNSR
jgi:hypothetical protein